MDIQKIIAIIEKNGMGVLGILASIVLYTDFKEVMMNQIVEIKQVQQELVISNTLSKQRLDILEKEQTDIKQFISNSLKNNL